MAITTNTQKIAVMEMGVVWEPGIPLLPGAIGQDDQQQLLWGYPGVLWEEPPPIAAFADLRDMCKWLFNTFIERW